MNASIEVDNLKCSGCANTIKKELIMIDGVSSVIVDNETSVIDVSYASDDVLTKVKSRLTHLGYPETDTLHGVNKLAANAKSYVSCALGRLS
jgi:copper chaperone